MTLFKGRYANTMQFVSIYLRCIAHLQTLTGFHFPMISCDVYQNICQFKIHKNRIGRYDKLFLII